MRIAVTISYTKSWSALADISVPNMAKYCVKHGYSLFATVDKYEKYNGSFKLKNIEGLLKEYDVVFSFDCDTLVTNHSLKLEDYIVNEQYFFVSEGMNMGVFGIRKSDMGKLILSEIQYQILGNKINCEQDYIDKMSDAQSKYAFKKYSHPAFNSYLSQLYPEIPQPVTKEQGQWEPGCFVLHVPALSIEKRIEVLKEYSQHIIYE